MEKSSAMRINKAIARAGICSRRRADELIQEGRVLLNGERVQEPGRMVQPGDRLKVDDRQIEIDLDPPPEHTYLMLNKPVQVVSTARDPQGRPTVLDLVPAEHAGKRLYPVGRLDFFSEGLLLLTDDGALTERLTHPRHHLPKRYEVLIRQPAAEAALQKMRAGMTLAEGDRLAPVLVERLRAPNGTERSGPGIVDGELLAMTLRQGVNRQIRRMCRDLGLTILRLCRTGQGPLELGTLPSGACRALTEREIAALRQAVGL